MKFNDSLSPISKKEVKYIMTTIEFENMEKIDRTKLNWEKIRQLPTTDDLLDKKYGKPGTKSREKFEKEADAYYTGQIIEDERKKAKLTQEQLAERIGADKSYISRVETGKTEPKVSTFYKIMGALGLSIQFKHIKQA